MKKMFLVGVALLVFSGGAHAFLWSAAVPVEIHIVPHGLVLVGDFDNTGVTCATGPKAIFLPKSDPNFREKLTLALNAKAAGKKIKVLINDPIASNCIEISAMGHVPIAYYYYWQIKD